MPGSSVFNNMDTGMRRYDELIRDSLNGVFTLVYPIVFLQQLIQLAVQNPYVTHKALLMTD